MPLTDPPPAFNPPWDLHILRGQGPVRLGRLLWVNWARAADETNLNTYDDYASRHNDVEMRFRPAFSIAGDSDVGFGIELNRRTGVLTANAWPVADAAPANFIVEVTVANNGTGVNGAHFPVARLRVHVHRQVDRIWLTPRRLSLRRPDAIQVGDPPTNTACTFTVRALFDDGVVGDITYSDQMNMIPADRFRRNQLGLWRIRLPDTDADGTTVPISATTTPAWGNQSVGGHIQILTPWARETNFPRAEWIGGDPRVLDGSRPPEDLPNVLFVSCGFLTDGSPADESRAFAALTDTVVQKMKSELLQPFGYLSDSINFWRLTIPGQDGGVSVRCEMYATMRDGQLLAWPVPAAKPLVSAGAEWTLENLIYMAGLPIRADLALVRNKNTDRPVASVDELEHLGADRLDFHLLEGKWHAIMQPLPVSNLPITVAREWLMLAERTFVDEVNNFPGIMIGTPPSASPDSDEKLRYDNSRDGAPGVFLLDHIVAAPRGNAPPITIRNPPDRAVGHLWLLNDDWAFRNRSLIVALSNVTFGRALHTEDGVLVRLYVASQDQKGEMSGLPVQPVADRNSLALAPLPATRIVLADTWRALVHELGHSFGLGDEYTERAETFQGPESDLDQFGNLTMPQTFLNPDGTLHLPQIKWNWHRIRNASVINQITEDGTSGQFPTSKRYKLQIHPQSFPWYGKGVNVLVRSRQRFVVINRTTKVSGPYIIEDVSAAGDVLTVEPTQGNTDLAGFLAGSIVFEPVPDVFPSTSQYRHLVSPAAERIMQAIRGTMTGAACVVSDQMARPDVEESTPLKADPLGRVTSKNLSRLVGAHFGGRLFACGVVHPSGHCMMRRGTDDSSSFCHVCRYVLVEQIAPEKHWLIDLDYDKEYPL